MNHQKIAKKMITLDEGLLLDDGAVRCEFRPVVVRQLLEKLNSTMSPRQKTEMCFDSRVYSTLMRLDPDYVLRYNFTFNGNRTVKITMIFDRDCHPVTLTTSGNRLDAEVRLFKSFVASSIEWIEEQYPECLHADAQMDSTENTEQGAINAEGEKAINTIMTRDVPLSTNHLPITLNQGMLDQMCCGQEAPSFAVWQDRKILLDQFNLSTTNGINTHVKSWVFPRDVYTKTDTPVNRPFEQFMFTKPNIEFILKINSQKFSTGRYVLSYYYEPYTTSSDGNITGRIFNLRAVISRDHVLIDLGESSEARLQIAFRNKCPFVTSLINNTTSVIGAANVIVQLHSIIPMRVGDGASTVTPCSAFVSLNKTKYIGMRYAIEPADAQMGNSSSAYDSFKDVSQSLISGIKSIPIIGGVVGGATNMLGHFGLALGKAFNKPSVVANMEKDLKYIGIINNRDKPGNFHEPTEFRPNPTGNLAVGTNTVESLMVMRLDPVATCVTLPEHMPEESYSSILEFCRIWGVIGAFNWEMTTVIDTQLYTDNVAPGSFSSSTQTVSLYTTPLDAFANFYTYYHGEVEYRFDFIINQFHTGIVKIAYVPHHDTFNSEQANSGYWKICDLREQKSFTFVVPYINNTVARFASQASPYSTQGISIPSPGSIKVFVVNPLNPIGNVPSTVSCIVYKRAAPNFRYSYPKYSSNNTLGNVHWNRMEYGWVETADAQMDDSQSEAMDQTPVLPLALFGGTQVQTNEDHMDIKNLMRRWTNNAIHSCAANTILSIPVTAWNFKKTGTYRSIQSFIAKQFRYYRGSLRFMFVARTVVSRVYITHIPQGPICVNRVVATTVNPGHPECIHFGGYASQIWIPTINPVFKIEIPWHGLFDYLDLQAGSANSYIPNTMYDRVAMNLGMILVTPSEDMEFEVYIAAGDDAEFIKPAPLPLVPNYVAPVTTAMSMAIDENPESTRVIKRRVCPVYPTPDTEVDAQMDDDETQINDPLMAEYTGPTNVDLPTPHTQGFCRSVYQKITNSMVNAVSPVTHAYRSLASLPRVASKLDFVADKAEAYLEYIKDAASSIVDGIKRSLSWVTNIGAIFSAILHFFQTLINPAWESFCISITGILVSIGCFATDFTSRLMDFFLKLRPARSSTDHRTEELADAHCSHDDCSTCRASCDPRCRVCSEHNGVFTDESIGSLVALMFASICGWLGWKGEPPHVSIAKGLFNFGKNFWLTIHQSGRFISSIITLIRRLFKYIGEKSGLGRSAITLTEQNNVVTNFVTEATLMLDQRNLIHLESSPAIKYRFWYCVAAAHQMVAKFTGSRLPEAVSVLRLAYKVIEKGNSIAIQSMACPVRYEPFVFALGGPSGIGKSFLLQTVLPEILASEAYNITTHAPPVFVRTPGVEFWNGYQNQPCILYDDFLAVTAPEIAVRQVIELYNLKSSAQFNLNMAQLDEKRMLGNPLMVALSCNNPFAVLNGTVCPEAFLRRKEHLWDVKLKACYKSLDDVPDDVKSRYDMYEFRKYSDPSEPKSLIDQPITFEAWKREMILSCKRYHKIEQQHVKVRLDGLQALLPETARDMMSEVDPYRIFYASYMGAVDQEGLIQSGMLPSQLIETQLRELANMPSNAAQISEYPSMTPISPISGARTPNNRAQAVSPEHPGTTLTPDEIERALEQLLADRTLEAMNVPLPDNDDADLADAQMQIIPQTAIDWLKSIMTAPNPDSPLRRPELYELTGECPICNMPDAQLAHGCENNHKICQDCDVQLRRAAENSATRYYCPLCRSTVHRLQEMPENAERILRPLVWMKKLANAGKKVYDSTGRYYAKCREYVKEHRWIQIVLYAALFMAYTSGITYMSANIDLIQGRADDRNIHDWADAGDPCQLTYMNRWGPWFFTTTRHMSRTEYRDRMSILDPNNFHLTGTQEERAGYVSELQQRYGNDGLNFSIFADANMDNEPEFEDATDAPRQPNLTRPQHPELIRCIWEMPPVHATTQLSCRHLAMLRTDPADVFYEIDDNDGSRMWHMGLFNSEVVYDAPCQFDQCAWKDVITRFNYLNRWAHCHSAEIIARKRNWDRTHGAFPLPLEFVSEEAIAAATMERTELYRAVEAFRQKTWWEFCCDKLKSFGKFIKLGLAIAAGIGMFLGAFKLFQHFRGGNEPVAQLVNSGSFNTRRLARTTVVPRVATATAQMSEDVEKRAVVAIEKNTIFLICEYESAGVKTVKKMRGFGLFGRTYMVPGHYAKFILTKLAKQQKGEISNLSVSISRFYYEDCVSKMEVSKDTFRMTNNDIAYGVTPTDFPMFKDITNYIPTVEQHTHIGGQYLHVECEPERKMIQSIPGVVFGLIDKQKIKGTTNWEEYEIFDAYMTSYGKAGSCGAILVCDTNTPLFAMHVAGHNSNPLNSTGYALPLIREDIEDLKRGEAVLSYWLPNLKDPAEAHMHLQGTYLPIGAVGPSMTAFMPLKTKIIPSLLQGEIVDENLKVIPTVTQPGILSPHDQRYTHDMSPLYHGCMKHTLPPKTFDQDRLDYCIDQISSELNDVMIPLRDIATELTIEESICGFNDRKYYDSIDLNTSAGWPWNTGVKKTKKSYIEVVRDKHSNIISCKVDKSLLDVMQKNDNLRKEGIRPFTVFLDWLKDERRKEKKIKLKDGTRIFSLSPLDLTIQARQMTLDFCASFMEHREQTESAVGIVVDGHEWSRMANLLLQTSPHIVTGDYSDFGPRLAAQIVRAAFKIIIRWYKHWGMRDPARIRKLEVLCEEICMSYHIMFDFIYQVMCGGPSGSPLTVIINTLANMLYIRYAWMKVFPMSDAKEYKSKVKAKFYGDDMIMSVHESVIELFNCLVLSNLFKEYDIVFTDASKTGTEKYTTLEKATFLKSGFLRHPKYEFEWLSPLEKTSIYECAQWIWKSRDNVAATLENAEQSLRLAYGHGPDFFKWWKKCLNRALCKMRMRALSLTWDHIDQQFFTGFEGTLVPCSRFDDGLGLNKFCGPVASRLKGEVRETLTREAIGEFLMAESSG